MFLEQNIRPKTISIEARNVKQNKWFEYARLHKADGWDQKDIESFAYLAKYRYYDTPSVHRMYTMTEKTDSLATVSNKMAGIEVIRVKTLIGEQLLNTNAISILRENYDKCNLSICLPGESDNAKVITDKKDIIKYIQQLSKDNNGFASFKFINDNTNVRWGKLKCNNGNIFHIAFLKKQEAVEEQSTNEVLNDEWV